MLTQNRVQQQQPQHICNNRLPVPQQPSLLQGWATTPCDIHSQSQHVVSNSRPTACIIILRAWTRNFLPASLVVSSTNWVRGRGWRTWELRGWRRACDDRGRRRACCGRRGWWGWEGWRRWPPICLRVFWVDGVGGNGILQVTAA